MLYKNYRLFHKNIEFFFDLRYFYPVSLQKEEKSALKRSCNSMSHFIAGVTSSILMFQ